MYKHFIITTSSYKDGRRIGMHFIAQDEKDNDVIRKSLSEIDEAFDGDAAISTHVVVTDSDSWESVVSYDSFFDGIYIVKSVNELIGMLEADLSLTGRDVAKYILSKKAFSQLELHKLIYLSYAEYLCEYDKRMFDDVVYAFKYGPVIKSLYEKHKGHADMSEYIIEESVALSRILRCPDGLTIKKTLDKVIDKYSGLSVGQLIDLTHSKGSPWDVTFTGGLFEIISDDSIKKYHCNEV